MTSPRTSLCTSIVSTSSSDGDLSEEENVCVPNSRMRTLPPPQTSVTVGKVVVEPGAIGPGVLHGTLTNINFNVLLNPGEVNPDNVNNLVENATKINSETCKSVFSSDNNSSLRNLLGTKDDLEGLSRRWWYLITALLILSITILVTLGVLSFTSWQSAAQGSATDRDPSIQTTMDGLSAEEKYFAAIPDGPRIITRRMWLAEYPKRPLDNNILPVTLVVVCHTATGNCSSQPECIGENMRAIQRFHQQSRLWDDIGFNFLIGGDGSVYWGRGFNFVGAHTKSFNYGSIGVAFIGTYIYNVPNDIQIEAFNKLIDVGVREGKISPDYTLAAQCQLQVTAAPGIALVHNMTTWPHYNSSLPVGCTTG